MRVSRSSVWMVLLLVALPNLFPGKAYAYLDPGTGSYVLQLLIAAVLGAAFAVKLFWLRIKNFVANLISKKPKDE